MARIPSADIQSRDLIPFLDMDNKSTKEKATAEYGKSISESIYTHYTQGKTEFQINTDYIDELRQIGSGKQGVDTYKKYVSNSFTSNTNNSIDISSEELLTYTENSADASRYGWINAIWDNVSPIANVKTTTKREIKLKDYDVRCNVVDIDAMTEEDMRMLRDYAKAQVKPLTDFLKRKWGLPVQNESVVSDYDRLVEIKKRGGYKPHFILGLQQIMKHTEDISDWDDNLKEKFFDDVFDLGLAFAIATYCPNTYKVKWGYVDPKDVIVQYSKRFDFADSDYFSYFEYPTVNQLRAIQNKITDGKKYGLNDEDWRVIGKKYTRYEHNPAESKWGLTGDVVDYSSELGEARTCVLHSWWIDYETEKEVEYVNEKYNRKKRRPYKEGEKIKKGDKLVQSSRIQKVYQCSWIVGTNFVYDFGPMPNQPRKNLREAMLPFAAFKMKEKSYSQRLSAPAHMFAIAWVRFCNAIAKAQNDFFVYDINAFADIDDGGKKWPWHKILKMVRQENILLINTEKFGPIGGSGVPVTRVQGTLGDDIMKEMAIMDSAYTMIEKMTGLSPVALGMTPQTDQAVGTTEMALSSGNKAVDVLVGGVMAIKKGLGVLTSSMAPTIIKEDEECAEAYARVIGEDDVEAIKKARREFMEIGINMEARPSDTLKRSLVEIAKLALGKRNSGFAGLNETQLIWIQYHFDTGGDFLEAFYKMQDWVEQDQKRIDAEQKAKQDAQTQSNATVAKMAEEEKRKTLISQLERDKEMERGKSISQRANSDADFINEMNKLKVEYMKEAGMDPIGAIDSIIGNLMPKQMPKQKTT